MQRTRNKRDFYHQRFVRAADAGRSTHHLSRREWQMSRAAPHWILCLFLLAVVIYGTACMEHARCADTLISRVASPDGTLVAAVFHRSCSGGTGLYTYARVEKPQRFFWAGGGEEVCHVVTISGHHAMEAVWKDSRRLAISSPDPLGQYCISSQHEACDDIQISYDLKVEPPPPSGGSRRESRGLDP